MVYSAGLPDPVSTVSWGDRKKITPVLSTSAYATGQSMFDLAKISNASWYSAKPATLQQVTIVDSSAQSPALTLVLFDRPVTLPAKGSTWNVSASDMSNAIAIVDIQATFWLAFGSVNAVVSSELGEQITPYSGQDVYLAAIIRSTATFTASALTISLGIRY